MTTTIHTRPDAFAAARKAMIDSQLRTSGINEAFVLERMDSVPRENFVPDSARSTAYTDRAIRLADGGFLAAPLFHAAMLAEARPQADDRALVIDAGSGYLPALVAPLVGSLDTISAEQAASGAKRGSYSVVLVDGAIEHVPPALAKLVAEHGRIVTGLIDRGITRLATGRKSGKTLALLPLAEMGVPRLGAFDKPQSWSF